MSIYLENSQGIQYDDVVLGDFEAVSNAIISRNPLIVRDHPDGSFLDTADFFETAVASFTNLVTGKNESQERVIAALNSFYSARHHELFSLTPAQTQALQEGLESIQQEALMSPSYTIENISYIVDYSKKDRAADHENQRLIPAAFCLAQAIESVNQALEYMQRSSPILAVTADDADDKLDINDFFLLIEDPKEEPSAFVEPTAPAPGLERVAARLKALFDQDREDLDAHEDTLTIK